MAHRRRGMRVASLIIAVVLGVVAITSGVLAQQRPTLADFELTKDVTYPSGGSGVEVGEEVTVTLTFRNKWVKKASVVVTDVNPKPQWFEIIPDSRSAIIDRILRWPSQPG